MNTALWSSLWLTEFGDADWVSSADYPHRLGHCDFLAHSWSQGVQGINWMFVDPTEANYCTLEKPQQVWRLRMLLKDLPFFLLGANLSSLYCDNISQSSGSCPQEANGGGLSLCEVVKKDISTSYVSLVDQIADIFTKGPSCCYVKPWDKLMHSWINLRGAC